MTLIPIAREGNDLATAKLFTADVFIAEFWICKLLDGSKPLLGAPL